MLRFDTQVRKALRMLAAICALSSASPAAAATLTRGPYLQLLTTHSATIVWNTDVPAPCGVRVGPAGGSVTVIPGGSSTVCAIAIDGLTAGASYGYTPLAGGVALAGESTFQVDDPTLPWTALVVGDSGSGGSKQAAVRDAMLGTPADLVLHTGDMIYQNGEPELYNPRFFAPYRDLLRRLVLWPCLGNHDVGTAAGQPWRDAFYTPANNAAGSENYYSFNVGNAHVVVLDSNAGTSPGSPQYTFLDQDLAATPALWKIVVFHHPVYSSGSSGGIATLRTNLVPVFDARDVDLVFTGHDHDYERTKPLANGQVVTPGSGTVYITTGGGGESIRGVGTGSFTAYSESAFHFTRLTEGGGWLLIQMIREDGAVRDAVTLSKTGAPPAPVCGDGLVNQATERCDGPDHPACPAGCAADCTCLPRCGDGVVNQPAEQCDGSSDGACPGLCLGASCQCGQAGQVMTLAPVADTFIESGTQATWDHGLSGDLVADEKPNDVAYLRFDLGGVTAPVAAATLTLYATNPSPDGGTVYPVGDSSWIEGNRTGQDASSAGGPGLTWSQVDTNGDGSVDALDTSPWVPDFTAPAGAFGIVAAGQTYTADVTRLFQNAPGVYTVAVKSNSDAGVVYGSRESTVMSQRPRLRLELVLPSTTTTTTSTSSSSSTSSSTPTSTSSSSSTSSSTAPTTTSSSSTTTTTRAPTTTSSTSSTTSSSTSSSTTTTTSSSTVTTTSSPTTSTTQNSTSSSTSTTTSSSSSSTTAPRPTTTTTSSTTTTVPVSLVVPVQADVAVSERLAGISWGSFLALPISAKSGKQWRTFLRVRVSGVGTQPVTGARLRLQVADTGGSNGPSGGRLHQISGCGWDERRMTWGTQPPIDGAVLDTAGPVQRLDVVRFDVSRAITGDGVYCFALESPSPDTVSYTSREGFGKAPDVVIDFGPPSAAPAAPRGR